MTQPLAPPVLGRPPDQDQRDQQALNYEHILEAAALAALLAAIAGSTALATALLKAGVPVPKVRARLVSALRSHRPNVAAPLRQRWAQGVQIGAGNALTDVGEAPAAARDFAEQVALDPAVRDLLRDLDSDLRAGLAKAATLAQHGPLATTEDIATVQAKALSAVNQTKAQITWFAHTAISAGTIAVAKETGAQIVWVAERDACCIPGTRVSAPSVLSPRQPARLVPENEAQRLTLDPAPLGVGLRRDRGPTAAPAVTEAVGDLSDVLGVSERDYVGQVITIRTAAGKEFTGTPNHPVATRRGWAALADLKVGDYVFSRRRGEGSSPGVEPNLDDVQPRIEEVAQAFQREVPSAVMPVAPEDFHGDGAGTEVGVVWAHRLLGDGGDASLGEHGCEEAFGGTDPATASLDGCGCLRLGLNAAGASPVGCDCRRDDGGSTLGVELVRAAEVVSDGQPVALKPASDRVHVDAIDYGDFLGRLATLVEPDEVVEIRHGEFRGHVYNLETVEGWYLSADIVSHNCLTCLALSGHTVEPGDEFPADATFAAKPMPLFPIDHPTPLLGPPRHGHCRCSLRIWQPDDRASHDLSTALKREAQRSVARGFSNYASKPVRLKAADKLLRHPTLLAKSVEARARHDVKRGAFSNRHNKLLPGLPPGE